MFSYLRPRKGLRPLSLTCRWLRECCLNVLFHRCIAFADALDDPTQSFPPPHLWRYVRALQMYGRFRYRMRSSSSEVVADAACGEGVLSDVLKAMPSLIHLIAMDEEERGVPWPILQVIFTVPQLRSLDLFGRLSVTDDAPSKPTLNASHIISFRYVPRDERKEPRSSASEKRIFGILLKKLAPNLEVLHLPCESVPFRKLDLWDWPRLQELYLRGDGRRLAKAGTPLITVLRRMPHLRRLSLKLGRCTRQRHLSAIWPPSCMVEAFPWPELESLALSWVDPQEQLFEHLPATFRDLRLRVWPRHYYLYSRPISLYSESGDNPPPSWAFETPSSSLLMQALQKCRAPTLSSLELEYEADSDDIPMLRYIAQSFPCLPSLHLFRYRSKQDWSPAPSENISAALSPLQNLSTLRLFLDFHHIKRDPEKQIAYAALLDLFRSIIRYFTDRFSRSLRAVQMLLADDEGYLLAGIQLKLGPHRQAIRRTVSCIPARPQHVGYCGL
ncbi:hypothetical protein FKP32DRAFT_1754963 [Trametes sanguinea]|nr:hypothetical protein FKP32DRAFT_1754963 [Trametes sanguinea]